MEAAEILRRRFGVERVVLFGSKARGEDEAESDIDLLVLTHGEMGQAARRAGRDALYPMEVKRNAWFGLMWVSLEDWEHGVYQAMPIRHEIDREGVLV